MNEDEQEEKDAELKAGSGADRRFVVLGREVARRICKAGKQRRAFMFYISKESTVNSHVQ